MKKENKINFSIDWKGVTISCSADISNNQKRENYAKVMDKFVVFLSSLDGKNGIDKPNPSIIPPPYDIVAEGYMKYMSKDKKEKTKFLKCMRCGKIISSVVPKNTVVRAFLECPECIEKDIKKEEQEKKTEIWNLKCSRCKKIVALNLPKTIGTIRAHILCQWCIEKEIREEKEMGQLKCSRCKKIVIKNIPKYTIVMAHIVCPDCVVNHHII